MKKFALNSLLLLMFFCLCGCSASTNPVPTREKAEHLFGENYELINTAVTILWEHYYELDNLVNDGESTLLLYSCGKMKDDFPYSGTSLTEEERSQVFAAWSALDENGASITYHKSLPDQTPMIAIHCGFDEMGRSFGYFYIRPVANEENGSLQDTVDKRIVYNGYNNSNSYAEWLSLSNDYWYQGTTAMVLLNK